LKICLKNLALCYLTKSLIEFIPKVPQTGVYWAAFCSSVKNGDELFKKKVRMKTACRKRKEGTKLDVWSHLNWSSHNRSFFTLLFGCCLNPVPFTAKCSHILN
jgi:hypothetical protein